MDKQIHNNFPFPLHSVLLWQGGRILQEEYFAPYSKKRMHRMFSITKAYTSLAVGALCAEGRISLDDPVVLYFPEYLPEDPHEYLTSMTIRDMLSMRTCHKSTTYKINEHEHWVRSFFVTKPDHAPGKIFKYDTSSAHTLAALVKKLSGKGVLDYLREVFLDRIGFSEEAYILCDPFGCEIGGSGMVAYPRDLLVTAQLLLSLYTDSWEREYPDLAGCADSIYDKSFFKRYAQYVREVMSYHCANIHDGKTLDECGGYGYQFWLLRGGGVMMYGMGGQYMLIYPKQQLIIITTADTQSVQGGTQYILDECYRIARECGAAEESEAGSKEDIRGVLRFREFEIPYSTKEYVEYQEPKYGQTLFTKAFPQADGGLYLRSQILSDYCGAIHFMLRDGWLYCRKVEESLFQEFNGFFPYEGQPS